MCVCVCVCVWRYTGFPPKKYFSGDSQILQRDVLSGGVFSHLRKTNGLFDEPLPHFSSKDDSCTNKKQLSHCETLTARLASLERADTLTESFLNMIHGFQPASDKCPKLCSKFPNFHECEAHSTRQFQQLGRDCDAGKAESAATCALSTAGNKEFWQNTKRKLLGLKSLIPSEGKRQILTEEQSCADHGVMDRSVRPHVQLYHNHIFVPLNECGQCRQSSELDQPTYLKVCGAMSGNPSPCN